jgi:hypothetical protein
MSRGERIIRFPYETGSFISSKINRLTTFAGTRRRAAPHYGCADDAAVRRQQAEFGDRLFK